MILIILAIMLLLYYWSLPVLLLRGEYWEKREFLMDFFIPFRYFIKRVINVYRNLF